MVRRPRLFSLSRLALGYSVLVAALLGVLWGYFWYELEVITANVQQQHQSSARNELLDGYQAIMKTLKKNGDTLADWDETRQQFAATAFYALWHKTRLVSLGLGLETLDDVALYDKQGIILSPSEVEDPLPARIPVTQQQLFLGREKEHFHLYYYRPVYADPANLVLLGYLGLKSDVTAALLAQRTFRYADLATLKLSISSDALLEAEAIAGNLQIAPLPDPDARAKHQLFKQALLRQALVLLATLGVALFVLRRWLVRPLRQLTEQIAGISDLRTGDSMPMLSPDRSLKVMELESLRETFHSYQKHLLELHGSLEQKSRDFYDQARRDALSGVYNRRAFEEDWAKISEDRRSAALTLMLFDCDHFKAINDTYGHHAGDCVIQATATCLESALRTEDRLYRLGGDEFAVLLREADPALAERVAERCLDQIHAHDFHQYGLREPISLSVGIALSQNEEHNLTRLQKRADLAMYAAKRPGNNKIVFYGEGMQDMEVLVGNREVNAVFHAIHDTTCIEMAYQGLRRLPAAEKEYAEALVRVRYDGELLTPAALFPIVQSRGLDVEFDLAILHAIRMDLRAGQLSADQGVSVNVSAPGVVNAKVISAVLDLVRAESQRKIVVEITETALITQMDIAAAHIQQLRDAGALVALDDFGSGYSSLRYLSHMPVDLVKFDISLVRMLESEDPHQRQLTQEIAAMVMNAGYEVVAEGVETQILLDRVIELGFSHAQGYFFGRPERE